MAHLENLGRMAEPGRLVLAGPFHGDVDLRVIYIFNLQTISLKLSISISLIR
jgi:uncharacterized protein YciI